MNVRQSTLLRSLLDIEHFTPVAEFARMLGCSEKPSAPTCKPSTSTSSGAASLRA